MCGGKEAQIFWDVVVKKSLPCWGGVWVTHCLGDGVVVHYELPSTLGGCGLVWNAPNGSSFTGFSWHYGFMKMTRNIIQLSYELWYTDMRGIFGFFLQWPTTQLQVVLATNDKQVKQKQSHIFTSAWFCNIVKWSNLSLCLGRLNLTATCKLCNCPLLCRVIDEQLQYINTYHRNQGPCKQGEGRQPLYWLSSEYLMGTFPWERAVLGSTLYSWWCLERHCTEKLI